MAAAGLPGKRIGRPRKPILGEVVLAHSRIEAGEVTVAEIATQFGYSRKNLAQELKRLRETINQKTHVRKGVFQR